MPDSLFSSSTTDGLKKMLSASDLRQKFLTNNIANANTPGYVAKDLIFDDFIKTAKDEEPLGLSGMSTTNARHLPVGESTDSSPFHLDGEFVRMFVKYKNSDEEEEMVNLAQNALTYRATADMISRKYGLLSLAITGGK